MNKILTIIVSFCLLCFFIGFFYGQNYSANSSRITGLSKIEQSLPTNLPIAPPASGPMPILDDSSLLKTLKKADVVGIAELKSLKLTDDNEKKQEDREYVALLQFETFYKGTLKSKEVKVQEIKDPDSLANLQKNLPCIYYLKVTENTTLQFLDRFYPGFPVLAERPLIGKASNLVRTIEGELIHNIKLGDELLVVESYGVLWNTQRGRSAAKTQIRNSKSDSIKSSAVAYLLRSKDADALNQSIKLIQILRSGGKGEYLNAINTIAQEIPSMSSSASVEQMNQLFLTGEPVIESAVGEIIRRVAVGEARRANKEELASLAISMLVTSKNVDVQYASFQLLCNIRNKSGPGIFEFAEDRKKHINEYVIWWNTVGKKKYGG